MLTDGLWIIVMFLSDSHSDGTHSLQSIHCWDTDAMLHFSKSDETSWMTWGWVNVNFLDDFILHYSTPLLCGVCAALDKADQHTVMQLLICLLPACNSDTLQCLLHFLSDVANHAEDSRDADGNEVSCVDHWGNLNLFCFISFIFICIHLI